MWHDILVYMIELHVSCSHGLQTFRFKKRLWYFYVGT